MCPTGRESGRQMTSNSDLRSAFDVLDVDHDGKISHEDLRTFYSGHLQPSSSSSEDDDVIGSMISMADFNNDGYVEYDEFEKVLDSKKRTGGGGGGGGGDGRLSNLMEDAFKVMDKDGDGKVGHDDLKSYLSWAGFEVSDDDVKAMIRLAGGDEDGGVSFDGLLNILPV